MLHSSPGELCQADTNARDCQTIGNASMAKPRVLRRLSGCTTVAAHLFVDYDWPLQAVNGNCQFRLTCQRCVKSSAMYLDKLHIQTVTPCISAL